MVKFSVAMLVGCQKMAAPLPAVDAWTPSPIVLK